MPEWNTSYYKSVPKDLQKNLQYRLDLEKEVRRNPSLAEELKLASSRDFLFWLSTFCFTYALDLYPNNPHRPMIPYPFQEEMAKILWDSIEERFCVAMKKSRYMGASWIDCAIFQHRAQFMKDQEFLMGSRTQDEVDRIGERGTLFGKLRYLVEHQPDWMRPPMESNLLKICYPSTGSIIKGESSNPNFGRSDRVVAVMLDEFNFYKDAPEIKATINSTSQCVHYISTLRGTQTTMYKTYESADGREVIAVEYLWPRHPLWSRGSYMGIDGKLTSPYREKMRKRLGNDRRLAEEIDGDVQAASSQFYDELSLKYYEKEVCREPLYTGDFTFDEDGNYLDFIERPDGCWRIWIPMERDPETGNFQRFPKGFFYSAADTSNGTGASNSTISIGRVRQAEDRTTIREKIAAFASPRHSPTQFARVIKASCQFFGECEVKPETNGPGRTMINELWDVLKWRRVWRQVKEKTISKETTNMLGWNPSGNRLDLHDQYKVALYNHKFVNPDLPSIVECRQFVYTDTQAEVIHSSENSIDDPSGARTAHGDRVVPDALLWSELKNMKAVVEVVLPPAPRTSIADFVLQDLKSRWRDGKPRGKAQKAEFAREMKFLNSFRRQN